MVRATPYGGPARAVRGLAVSGIATGLAAGGHTLGGGAAPSPAGIVTLALLLTPLCVRMSGVEWTLRRLVGVLMVAQAGFHLAFMGLATTHHTASPLLMATWHLVATATSIVLLRYSERALAALISRVAVRRVATLLARVLIPGPPRQSLASRLISSHRPDWQRSPLPLRGPPTAA
jgi:hypothetical protein